MTLPPPFPLLTRNGKQMWSGSSATLRSKSPQTLPLPSIFLIGIHARFCNSMRWLRVQDQAQTGWPESAVIHKAHVIPREIIHRAIFSLRSVWLHFPKTIRVAAYRLLFVIGFKLYGTRHPDVQRVPFGFYIKRKLSVFMPLGEVPAMNLVEQHTDVPAPRVLDVLTTGPNTPRTNFTYLVMTCLPGIPLSEAIPLMSYPERRNLVATLQDVILQFRSIPNPNTAAICNASGGPLFDHRLPRIEGTKLAGPFESEADFNNRIVGDQSLRSATHDLSHQIYFTHADLHPNNILISAGKLSGVVDYGLSGFYPEYWEYTKAVYTHFGPELTWPDIMSQTFSGSYVEELKAEKKMWAVNPPW